MTGMNRIWFIWVILVCAALLAGGCNIPHAVVPESTATELPAAVIIPVQPTETRTAAPVPTETFTPEPSPSPTPGFLFTPTPTLGAEYFHGSFWYDPDYVSQRGLKFKGKTVNTGCTAAAVQMVLDFWHNYKEDYQTISAQRLIDLNTWQNRFSEATGLNIMNTEDELKDLNYYLGTRQDSDKEELLTALERYGPLLVLTKVNWTPFGANHMAVVTGYDEENDIIRVLDPWQEGGIMEFPYDNFDGIWSLNYLDDPVETLRRTFFFIVPFAELCPGNAPFVPYSYF